jgi:hypothetical protein
MCCKYISFTLIQTITRWMYYHTTAKLYDFIRWILYYVYRATLYLYWFSKETRCLIIHTRASAVDIWNPFNNTWYRFLCIMFIFKSPRVHLRECVVNTFHSCFTLSDHCGLISFWLLQVLNIHCTGTIIIILF